MRITQTTIWTTLAALLVAAVAIATLSAHPAGAPQDPQQRPRQGRGLGPGRGPGPMFERLDLTEQQREQIRTIMQESRAAGEAPMQKVGALQRDLQAAIFADAPDQARIDQLRTAITEAEAEALNARIAVELKVAQVLTAEQRAKARELPGRGQRGGHGGRGARH